MNRNNINLQLDVLKEHLRGKSGKEAKATKELFCALLYYKMLYSNSVILHLSVYSLRKDLQIGAKKANRLFHQIMNSDMCSHIVNSDGSLKVWIKSFKIKGEKLTTKRGEKYRYGMMMKFPVADGYSLKDLYALMNEMLVMTPVAKNTDNDVKHDRSQMKSQKQQKSSADTYHSVPLKSFASCLHMSSRSAARIKNNLVSRGVLKQQPCRQYTELISDEKGCKSLLKRLGKKFPTFVAHGLIYVVLCSSYSIYAELSERMVRPQLYNYKAKNEAKNAFCNPPSYSTIPQMNGF